jgi:sigma-B regulation protein RsbU (phosphoserine phosphatase)
MLYRCAEDDIQSIETVSFPLGIRARAKYSNNKLNLLPGDKILFYTDGLVEATNTENEMIGYKQAREWFADCKNLGAEETVTRLFALFDQATHLSSAEDDISLIALQRKK